MQINLDLTDLSIMQRYKLKELLIKFFNTEARDIKEDIASYDEGEAKNQMLKWMEAAKTQAESVRKQTDSHFTLEVGKRVKIIGRPRYQSAYSGRHDKYGTIGVITKQDGYAFTVDGIEYEGQNLTCNF